MIQFHETGYGRKFLEVQLPDLIESINNLAKSVDKLTEATLNNVTSNDDSDLEEDINFALDNSDITLNKDEYDLLKHRVRNYDNSDYNDFISEEALRIKEESEEANK